MQIEKKQTSMKRLDNRDFNEFLPFTIYPIDKGNANSKLFFESQANKFFCTIYGPFNRIGMQTHECDITVTIIHSANNEINKKQTMKEKSYTRQIKQLLDIIIIKEQYLKQSIEVGFDILEDSGSLQQHLINAMAIALPLAGIQIYDQFSAISISLINDQLIVDQTEEELENSKAVLNIAIEKQTKQLLLIDFSGNVKADLFKTMLSFGLESVINMSNYLADILKQNILNQK